MDLSLMMSSQEFQEQQKNGPLPIEKEHMFDKVVTPSDVGKLNRLVIPKQHAEKFFPLNASSNEKGLLLNFEDRNGKPWRFRYSYWNSSQSYVMTKGWSRFVKDKKLDAGDIVSFQRGIGESQKERLYIDYRHRPEVSRPRPDAMHTNYFHPWGRMCSFSHPIPRIHHFDHFDSYNRFHSHQNHYGEVILGYGGASGLHYMASTMDGLTNPNFDHSSAAAPLVIDSVPIVPGRTTAAAGKRLRLFGVNMECAAPDQTGESSSDGILPCGGSAMVAPVLPPPPPSSSLQLRLPNHTQLDDDQYAKKGKSSLSFDLDL